MKKKLRQINVDNKVYLYSVRKRYNFESNTYHLKVKIFLNGRKNTPLIINFDDNLLGQLLNVGVLLLHKQTHEIVKINLNEPQYIKDLILLGQQKGWTGENNLGVQDGCEYLVNLGYELKVIKPYF